MTKNEKLEKSHLKHVLCASKVQNFWF